MPDTLTITVDANASGETTFRVHRTQYGDGYAQRSRDGINHKVSAWDISKSGPLTEVGPLRDFLDAHGGDKAFNWTPPNGVLGLYTASRYSEQAKHGSEITLTVQFQQEFSP